MAPLSYWLQQWCRRGIGEQIFTSTNSIAINVGLDVCDGEKTR
jgi:hypothetical protein